MKKKEINEMYGIKMILEEMYVWNDVFEDGFKALVFFYDVDSVHVNKYHALIQEGGFSTVNDYKNAISLEEYEERKNPKPIVEKIKFDDYGYFWNDRLDIKCFFWGKLSKIYPRETNNPGMQGKFFITEDNAYFDNFSKTRPEWSNHN
jgi:hypothetical protein